MSSIHKSRAQHLMSQSRYDSAITELQKHVSEQPDDAYALAMISECHTRMGNTEEAIPWVNRALQIGPNVSYCHWARAYALKQLGVFEAAETTIAEALRLSPANASYYSLLGQIRLNLKNWKGAVEAAEMGLAIDPVHSFCSNVRAMALLQMGKTNHAEAAIKSALANNPEDPITHTNQGWICLESGEADRALAHFKEALRINPNTASVRQGVLEAMANKYVVYRMIYRYYQWMGRLSVLRSRGIILGIFLTFLTLVAVTKGEVQAAIAIVYCTYALLTWTGRSPFDLLIRLNPLGRLALTHKQINASNWVGACFAGFFVSVALGVIHGDPLPMAASGCFAMLAILGAGMARSKGNLRKINISCAIAYTATVLLEAADMVFRDPIYWAALLCLLVILLPGIGYIWITERIRRTHEV